MSLSEIVPASTVQWTIPVALFFGIIKLFDVMDNNTSSEAKAELTSFIENKRYDAYLGHLPVVVEAFFRSVFGDRHLSGKCFRRSIWFSLAATFGVAGLFVIYDHTEVIKFLLGFEPALDRMYATALSKPETKASAPIIASLRINRNWLFVIPIVWAAWCLIPDYVNLLKARVVLLVLKSTDVSVTSMFLTLAIDFFIGIVIFFLSFVSFQVIMLNVLLAVNGYPFGDSPYLNLILFWVLFASEFTYLTITGIVFQPFPIGILFWATILPSIWLWSYVISALISRSLFALRPTFERLTYFLDTGGHPVRAIGFVAASTLACTSFILVAILQVMK